MKKANALLVVLTGLSLLVFASIASAASIAVTNPSFELPAQGLGGFSVGSITGWSAPGVTGVFHPFDAELASPTDGVQVGFANTASVSQVLADTLTANTQYTLQVDFLARKDCCIWPGSELDFMAGPTVLASDQILALPAGGIQTSTVSFTALPGNPDLGQALEIRITPLTLNSQIDFDNVRLDATPTVVPEPGTPLMLAMAMLAGVAAWGRRRQNTKHR